MITIDCGVRVVEFEKNMQLDEYVTLPSKAALNLDGTFTFAYDYPLSKEARFEHRVSPDMSALDILTIARADYERIYQEEDEDVGRSTGMIPGMLNRQRSDGRWGIWGHVIDDLFFEAIQINDVKNTIEFGIGS